LDILRHDGDTLGVDGTQVSIFEKTNKVSLGSFLKSEDGRSLEAKVGLEILGDLTNKTLEGQLADEKVGGLLVTTDLTKGDGSRAVTVGLLDTSGGGGRLTSCLGGKLLTGSLSSGRFTCGLLGTGHFDLFQKKIVSFSCREAGLEMFPSDRVRAYRMLDLLAFYARYKYTNIFVDLLPKVLLPTGIQMWAQLCAGISRSKG
jgi:histone H3